MSSSSTELYKKHDFTITSFPNVYYLLRVDLSDPSKRIDEQQLQLFLVASVKSLHGSLGSAFPIDIIEQRGTSAFIVRIPIEAGMRFEGAMAIACEWPGGIKCRVRIEQKAPLHLAL